MGGFDMSFDPVSYAMGQKAGGGGAELYDAAGTIYENGVTTFRPDTGYDGFSSLELTTEVPNTYTQSDVGKVVVSNGLFPPAYSLEEQSVTTVYENGEYDTTTVHTVNVAIPEPSRIKVVSATLADMTTHVGAMADFGATNYITFRCTFDLSSLGMGSVTKRISVFDTLLYDGAAVYITGGAYDGTSASVIVGLLVTASSASAQQLYLIQGGQIADLTQYAGSIMSDIEITLVKLPA